MSKDATSPATRGAGKSEPRIKAASIRPGMGEDESKDYVPEKERP